MAYQSQDPEDEWGGWQPEEPREDRRLMWLAAGSAILFLIGACLIGGYFLLRQFQNRTEPAPTLVVPTSVANAPTPRPTQIPAAQASPTNAPLAPTATLNQSEPEPTPPIGAGAVEAIRLSPSPTIDGDLAEWPDSPTASSSFRVYSAAGWDGSDDLAAVWRLAWDATYLYIAVEVTDEAHVQTQTGNQIFRGDSLDMQFDTQRAADYGDGLSPDDFQIVFSPGDFADLPPSAHRFQGTAGGRIVDAPGGHNITVAALPTAKSYNLEAAIPWSDLGLTPNVGLVIGIALNASDNDLPGTAVQEVMNSHVSGRTLTNPTTWGTLTLQ